MLIAFSIEMFNSSDGPTFASWKLGYAIEMTFDGDWPFDFVALAPPPVFRSLQKNDFDEFRIELGLSYIPNNAKLSDLIDAGASWVLAYPSDRWDLGLRDRSKFILYIEEPADIQTFDTSLLPPSDRLQLAVKGSNTRDIAETQQSIERALLEWDRHTSLPRPNVLMATGFMVDRDNDYTPYVDFISKINDIEGVLLLDASPLIVSDFCQAAKGRYS